MKQPRRVTSSEAEAKRRLARADPFQSPRSSCRAQRWHLRSFKFILLLLDPLDGRSATSALHLIAARRSDSRLWDHQNTVQQREQLIGGEDCSVDI